MASEYRRAALFLLAVCVVIGGMYWGFPRLISAASGPEDAVMAALKKTETDGLGLEVPGRSVRLVAQRHSFDRITVSVEKSADAAVAFATLDFNGTLGEITVSSLGRERIPFRRDRDGWKPAGSYAPELVAVVVTLEARRQALASGNLGELASLNGGADFSNSQPALSAFLETNTRRYRARAWFIRLDRDEFIVTEQYEDDRDQAREKMATRRLRLYRREGKLLFRDGLM